MKHFFNQSFLLGVSRILDISGSCLSISPIRCKFISPSGQLRSGHSLSVVSSARSDSEAIHSDFVAVGKDLNAALQQYAQKYES